MVIISRQTGLQYQVKEVHAKGKKRVACHVLEFARSLDTRRFGSSEWISS